MDLFVWLMGSTTVIVTRYRVNGMRDTDNSEKLEFKQNLLLLMLIKVIKNNCDRNRIIVVD